jgi:hypothetical protein
MFTEEVEIKVGTKCRWWVTLNHEVQYFEGEVLAIVDPFLVSVITEDNEVFCVPIIKLNIL